MNPQHNDRSQTVNVAKCVFLVTLTGDPRIAS